MSAPLVVNGEQPGRGDRSAELIAGGEAFVSGLHRGIPMSEYLALDAIGSSRLEWLATSPLHYRYMLSQPREVTAATERGTALHTAVLEPEVFTRTYVVEPLDAAPNAIKPRATKAYKDACADIEMGGQAVLRVEEMAGVTAMAAAILAHPHAARLLARAPEREVTMLWERDGHRCRGRADLLGEGVIGDLKTTRSLRDFSPWAITKLGYYRQSAWYQNGLQLLGREIEHVFFVAVESTPPHDVGVFVLEEPALVYGQNEIDYLMWRLGECERTGVWPGMFPDVVPGMVTNALAEQMAAVEGAA